MPTRACTCATPSPIVVDELFRHMRRLRRSHVPAVAASSSSSLPRPGGGGGSGESGDRKRHGLRRQEYWISGGQPRTQGRVSMACFHSSAHWTFLILNFVYPVHGWLNTLWAFPGSLQLSWTSNFLPSELIPTVSLILSSLSGCAGPRATRHGVNSDFLGVQWTLIHSPSAPRDDHLSCLFSWSYFSQADNRRSLASCCRIARVTDCSFAALSVLPSRNTSPILPVCRLIRSAATCFVMRSAQLYGPGILIRGTCSLIMCSCSQSILTSRCLTFDNPRRSMMPCAAFASICRHDFIHFPKSDANARNPKASHVARTIPNSSDSALDFAIVACVLE